MDENQGIPITYQLKKRIELLEKLSHEPQNYREKCEEMEKRIEVLEKKIVIGLFDSVTPITSDNFYQLCVNHFYDNSPFHRIIKDFMIQGGDFTRGDGTGGHAFKYSPSDSDKFDDENFNVRHEPYVLSMANAGKNTNGSQFFITLIKTDWLDGKHVVFGRVLHGKKIAKLMESFGSSRGKTSKPVTLVKCEEVPKKKPKLEKKKKKLDNVAIKSHQSTKYTHKKFTHRVSIKKPKEKLTA